MALIELDNVTKSYFSDGIETPVLKDVSLKIEKGEFVAVMGPSGSGKSTILHILGFLDRPTSGTYRFNGKTIDELSDTEIAVLRNKDLGFVFQMFYLLPRTSVIDNVKLPLIYSDVPEDRWNELAEKAVKSVGLDHRMNHDSAKLSGGEKQRVAIARALVNSPKVIFADEPTGNLDSKSGGVVMNILERLNEEEGLTVVLITHETETAEHAKRIVKIRDGVIESDYEVGARKRTSEGYRK